MKTILNNRLLNKVIFILSFTVFFILNINISSAKNLWASLSYSTFFSPTDGPYIETYFSVVGKTVVFIKNDKNKYQGAIEVTLIFKQNDSIKSFKKYNLLSPEIDDTSDINFNFIDQQRFLLHNGTYDFEITISDKNSKTHQEYRDKKIVIIDFPPDEIRISDIQLVETYKKSTEHSVLTKSGYDIVPFVVNFFPEYVDTIIFYSEIYNTDVVLGESQEYLITYFIESYETHNKFSDFTKIKKQTSEKVNILFAQFDISKLASGNYNLVIEIRNRENKMLASNKLFFQRSNLYIKSDIKDIASVNIENTFTAKYNDKKILTDYIQSLYPVSTQLERMFNDNQLKISDLETMQKYFFHFWIKRDKQNPEKKWLSYLEEVKKVNANYGTRIRRGYQTDRGRVYLQYGPPNTISKHPNEPSAYPYEIWHYYTLDNQKNRKFVFYNPDLVTNDYELIHSNAIGEISNYSWETKIYGRNTEFGNPDETKGNKHYGGKADEYYDRPR
jgi:GWxTD domain-containing protein